jgi:hypothetical protein
MNANLDPNRIPHETYTNRGCLTDILLALFNWETMLIVLLIVQACFSFWLVGKVLDYKDAYDTLQGEYNKVKLQLQMCQNVKEGEEAGGDAPDIRTDIKIEDVEKGKVK